MCWGGSVATKERDDRMCAQCGVNVLDAIFCVGKVKAGWLVKEEKENKGGEGTGEEEGSWYGVHVLDTKL